jgi:hypothetical protein
MTHKNKIQPGTRMQEEREELARSWKNCGEKRRAWIFFAH